MSSHDPLFDRLVHAMDETPWTTRRQRGDVVVQSGDVVFAPGEAPFACEGFRIEATRDDLSLDHAIAFFHDACHFADTANAMTTRSEIVRVDDDRIEHYRAVVRTGFALPWPLQDREFLHLVATRRDCDPDGRERVLIAYDDVSWDGLPPAWPGYLRCRTQPSGQRATRLEDGRVRVEHCMTYPLGGRISPGIQNSLFHRGHVRAYLEEWEAAMAALAAEVAAGPALGTGRTVRGAA